MNNRILSVGDDVSDLKIYQIINKYFSKNYKGWMKAWYDVNAEFAAWFPTITKTDERPNGAYGGTQNCSNTLSNDRKTIIEIDHDHPAIYEDEDPKFGEKHRLIFARIDGHFEFLGVFDRIIIGEGNQTKKMHVRVAEGVDLDSFELYLPAKDEAK